MDFSGAKFSGTADFRRVEFYGGTDFGSAEFNGIADFFEVDFVGGGYFEDAEFHGRADFGRAEFYRGAAFFNAEFDGEAYFRGAEFYGDADFGSAEFNGNADFMDVEFSGSAAFPNAEFGSDAYFWDVEFSRGGNFGGTVASNTLDFRRSTFPSKDSKSVVSFQDVVLSNPQNVRFENVDLSRVSFERTDVSQVHFVGRRWATMTEPCFWLIPFWKRDRNAIYDELALGKQINSDKSGEVDEELDAGEEVALVGETYRQLRINLEATRQEVEAGDFYVGQMEMRRQNPSEPWFYRILLNIYRALASYGEDYIQPFVWYALIFAPLFALAYWLLGDVSYADGLFSAITAGSLFRFEKLPDGIENWEKLLVFFNMAVDILLITLIVIALRRRFHR